MVAGVLLAAADRAFGYLSRGIQLRIESSTSGCEVVAVDSGAAIRLRSSTDMRSHPPQRTCDLIPAPQRLVADQVHATEPAIDAVDSNVIHLSRQHRVTGLREYIHTVRFVDQREAAYTHRTHVALQALISHEDALLELLLGGEEGVGTVRAVGEHFQNLPF